MSDEIAGSEISITITSDEGVSLKKELSPDEAYVLGMGLIEKSGINRSEDDKPLLEQLPWMSISDPPISFQATGDGGVMLAIKPAGLRAIFVLLTAESAVNIHRILGGMVSAAAAKRPSGLN